jgi:hypothetical protein
MVGAEVLAGVAAGEQPVVCAGVAVDFEGERGEGFGEREDVFAELDRDLVLLGMDVAGGEFDDARHRLGVEQQQACGESVARSTVVFVSRPRRIWMRLMSARGVVGGLGRIEVVGYNYAIEHDGRDLVSYHWHPQGESPITWPHMHVGTDIHVGGRWFGKAHLPTGVVGLERVVALAITELGAKPLRDDWE